MYYPTLEEVKGMVGRGNLVPVYRAVQADLETPVSAYLKVARPPYSFLLESVEGGERIARYSFIGTEPYKVVKTGPGQPHGRIDPLIPVQEEMERFKLVPVPKLPRFHGGGVHVRRHAAGVRPSSARYKGGESRSAGRRR